MTTEELLNVKTCFRLNGTDSYPVTSQILLPDLSDFQVRLEDSLIIMPN